MAHLLHRTFLILFAFLIGVSTLTAQDSDKPFSSPNFPVPFGPNNIGTEFYTAFPANWEYQATTKIIRLYISAGVATKVDIYALGIFKGSITTIPNDIVTFDLSNIEGQVFVRNDQAPLPDDQIYPGKALRIVSQDPIVVYAINRTNFTSDGMLVLPVNALGQRYVVASAASVAGGIQELPSQYMIIAPYDNTTVNIVNPMSTPNHGEGQSFTINMNKGDVYSAMSVGFSGDLSGARITASKPIAVTAGQNCTYLPSFEFPACNHIEEMLTPVESWGKYYHSIPFQGRTKGDTYRIFAGEPNAEIYLNGDKIATLSSVGGRSGFGWIEYRDENRYPMEFSSNKRIFVAQYNNSQTYDGASGTDPFYVILTPVEQYQEELIFSTPAAEFPLNYISIIGDSLSIEDAELTRAGTENWQKLTSLGGTIYTFPTRVNGKKYLGVSMSITPGVYRLRTTGTVAGYIYAGSGFDSYGYPLSVSTANLEKPDVDPPPITKTQECDGSVAGNVRDMPDEDDIRSNLSTIRLLTGSENYILSVQPFTANVTRQTTYTLRVRDPKLDAVAYLEAADAAGNVTLDTAYYFARDIEITPDPLDFGEVLINTSPPTMDATIKNNGNRAINIVEMVLQKGTEGFDIIDPAGSFILGPGEQRSVTISFLKNAAGQYEDSLGFTDDCGTFWVSLVKAEIVVPIISVSDHDFGDWPIDESITDDLIIENVGSGTLRVTGVASNLTDPVFTLPNGLPAFPLNLRAGQRQLLKVQFLPTAEVSYRDSIVFEHNAPAHPQNDPTGIVTGRGIQATLFATPYDWLEKRVGSGPWIGTVYIRNLGTQDAKVYGIKSESGDVNDFNIDDELNILNVTVPAGGEIPVQVSFTPQAVGNRQMKVIFNVDDQTDTTLSAMLTGIGVVPGLGTEDLNFGSMLVGAPEIQRTVDFTLIRNYSSSITGDYRDSVWIDGFDFVSDDDGLGNADFRYDPIPGGLPILLKRGETESVTITGYFSAKAAGARNASIRARTRDNVDTTSRWRGVGGTTTTNPVGRATATPGPTLCVGEDGQITVTIFSEGTDPLNVTDITLNDPNNEFVLDNPPGTPFAILPTEDRAVNVTFTPKQSGPRSATLIIATDDPNNPTIEVELTGVGSEFAITGQVMLTGTDLQNGNAVLGERVSASILTAASLDPVGAKSYTVTMTYDAVLLTPPSSAAEITLNATIHPAGSVATINSASSPGTLIIDVTSPQVLTGSGGLLSVPFGVAFDTLLTRTVAAKIEFTSGASCGTIDIADGSIDVTRICGLNLRLIELVPNGKFALVGARPNPVSSSMAEIEYSIGLDAPTRVLLYDASGNYISTLVDQYQQPGLYRVGFEATTLSSGLYYCILESGHYHEVKPLLIAR